MNGLKKVLQATLCAFLFSIYSLLCAHAEVKLSVNPESTSLGRQVTLAVTVRNEEIKSPPTLKESSDFSAEPVGAPSQSLIDLNGWRFKDTTFYFKLIPKKSGTLTTPQVTVVTDKGTATPLSLVVEVNGNSDVIFEQSVSPKQAYVGQQILLTHQLLSRYELREIALKEPAAPEFWVDEITPDEKDKEIRGGTEYSVLRKRRAAFPLTSGTITLAPKVLTAKLFTSNVSSLLEDLDPFNSHMMPGLLAVEPEQIELSSNASQVIVKELPTPPLSLHNWGAGTPLVATTVKIDAATSPLPIRAGDAKEVIFTVETDGNLNSIKEIPIEENVRYKQYQSQGAEHPEFNGRRVLYRKSFSVSVVPVTGGDFEIQPITLSFFDPNTESYKSAVSPAVKIPVLGTADPNALKPPPPKVLPTVAAQLVMPTEGAEGEEHSSITPAPTVEYRNVLVICAVFLVSFGILNLFLGRGRSRAITSQREPANLKNVTTLDELYRMFLHFIAIKLHHASPTTGSVRHALSSAPLDSRTRFEIESILDELEEVLYGQFKEGSDRFSQLKARAETLLENW